MHLSVKGWLYREQMKLHPCLYQTTDFALFIARHQADVAEQNHQNEDRKIAFEDLIR